MLYILLGSKDEDVFFGLSPCPRVEPPPPIPAITLILPPLLLCAENEDDELVGTIACVEGSLLLLLVFSCDIEVIRLRSFVFIDGLVSLLFRIMLLTTWLVARFVVDVVREDEENDFAWCSLSNCC